MKKVLLNEFAVVIPGVCENNIDNVSDFINVDLPPALGPVISISIITSSNFMVFLTIFSWSSEGCQISIASATCLSFIEYSGKQISSENSSNNFAIPK